MFLKSQHSFGCELFAGLDPSLTILIPCSHIAAVYFMHHREGNVSVAPGSGSQMGPCGSQLIALLSDGLESFLYVAILDQRFVAGSAGDLKINNE